MDSNSLTTNSALPIKVFIIGMIIVMIMLAMVAAFFSAKKIANDKIRVHDIALIQKYLEAYHGHFGVYPAAVKNAPIDWHGYLEYLPEPPRTASGCSAAENAYQYSVSNQGQNYKLSFCLGDKTDKFSAGPNVVSN
ncbi:MAG: hypothetical protein KW788_03035 [Candidatus Doudnabacteria bacterium]|nr:hypothetical protein [Candidatus Doudnabacteria bacterium]